MFLHSPVFLDGSYCASLKNLRPLGAWKCAVATDQDSIMKQPWPQVKQPIWFGLTIRHAHTPKCRWSSFFLSKLGEIEAPKIISSWFKLVIYPVLYPLASPFLLVIYLLIFQANTSFQFCHSTCNRSVPSTVRAAQLLFGALAQETIPLLRVVLAANDGNLVGLERNSQFVMIIPSALVYKE
jgi:hypothetical protein